MKKYITLVPRPYPNPDDYYTVEITRKDYLNQGREYVISEERARAIAEIVNFSFDLKGGEISLHGIYGE